MPLCALESFEIRRNINEIYSYTHYTQYSNTFQWFIPTATTGLFGFTLKYMVGKAVRED